MRYVKQKELFLIICAFLIISISYQFYNLSLFNEAIKPIVYTLLILYSYYIIKKSYVRNKENKYLSYKMLIISIIYCIIFYTLGFFIGFSKSPYNHSITGIIKNITQVTIPIIGIELLRGNIISKNKKNKIVIIIATILLLLLEINYSAFYNNLERAETTFKYICSVIIPLIFSSFVYTYLVYRSSYRLPLIFRIIQNVLVLTIPLYPSVNWFVTGTLGVLTPVTIFFLYKYRYFKEEKKKQKIELNKVSFATAIIVSTLLVSFMLGLFKYEPIAILSNSMHPSYDRGDVVVYEKLDEKALKNLDKDSIIIYRISNQNVAHRIIEVVHENGNVYYRTQGDANNAPDGVLVEPDQIVGVYVLHIKYIGFPSVWLHEYFTHDNAVVETK